MNKKGFLKIIEASVAIILVLSVLFVFYLKNQEVNTEVDLTERARSVLDELSKSVDMREAVISENQVSVDEFIGNKITESSLEYEVRICEINEVCGMSRFVERDIYVGERIISSTLTSKNSKKIRLFIWRE